MKHNIGGEEPLKDDELDSQNNIDMYIYQTTLPTLPSSSGTRHRQSAPRRLTALLPEGKAPAFRPLRRP